MSTQTGLTDFGVSTGNQAYEAEMEIRDEHPEEWGPTMVEPLPEKEHELATLPGSGGIDERELAGTGLAPVDVGLVDPWLSGPETVRRVASGAYPKIHPADRDRPDRRAEEAEKIADLEGDADSEPLRVPHPSNIHTEYPEFDELPEDIPIDAEAADITLANRFIRGAIREYGHHDPSRRAFQDWAKKEDVAGVAYDISVDEWARGGIDGKAKAGYAANVILDWAKSEHSDLLREVTQRYNDDLREKCEKQLEEEQRQAEARAFQDDPPETVGDWERFEPDKPDAILAYRSENHGTPAVAVVYETPEGEIDAHETTWNWWQEAETAADSKVNRHFVRAGEDDPFRDLLSHLETFDVDPFPDDLKAENTHPDAGGVEEVATDGGTVQEPETPIVDPENPPENEQVLLIQGITRVMHTPRIVEGETSSTGKTITVELENGNSFRLDPSQIFAGESEFRDAKYFEIYTPARMRKNQRANKAPGPQAGANEVSDADDLPEPTHWPTLDEPDAAPDECPECGQTAAPWDDKRAPVCEACGYMDEKEEEDDEEETPDKWDLSHLDRGDLLILEGYRGEFVITQIHHFQGTHTVNRLEAAKREGGEWRTYELNKLDSMEGYRLQVKRESETTAFVNVDDPDHARDFEVVGNDMDRVRSYIRDTRQ